MMPKPSRLRVIKSRLMVPQRLTLSLGTGIRQQLEAGERVNVVVRKDERHFIQGDNSWNLRAMRQY